MHVPFPLQCSDVIAKLRGNNNIAKGRGRGRKGVECSKVFQGFCLRLQSSPKILETLMHVPFPLQC